MEADREQREPEEAELEADDDRVVQRLAVGGDLERERGRGAGEERRREEAPELFKYDIEVGALLAEEPAVVGGGRRGECS